MINFPNTPTIGDVYYAPSSGVSYRWDGTLWLAYPSAGPGYGPSGDFCAVYTANTGTPTTMSLLTTMPVTSGNAGGWYVPATGRYTPPPGRYYIHGTICAYSTAGAVHHFLELRKNGSVVTKGYDTIANINWYTDPAVSGIFDCNGSDYFELWGTTSGGGGIWYNITFMAYPIAGAKGPTGDKGATGDLGNLAALHLQDQVEVTSGSPTFLRVAFPNAAKKIQFSFYAETANGANGNLCFQWMAGANPIASASYYGQYMYGANAGVAAAPVTALAYWSIGGLRWWSGEIDVWLTKSLTLPTFFNSKIYGVAAAGDRYVWSEGGHANVTASTVTGFNMFYSTGEAFAVGSFLKCFSIN